mmetsp:Transcript_33804/g.66504  ORF Transcript_33804/g.66504 Transcript_33804/m.66504 type:complete len:227 (+) Transcript_33804:2810-3490(+)
MGSSSWCTEAAAATTTAAAAAATTTTTTTTTISTSSGSGGSSRQAKLHVFLSLSLSSCTLTSTATNSISLRATNKLFNLDTMLTPTSRDDETPGLFLLEFSIDTDYIPLHQALTFHLQGLTTLVAGKFSFDCAPLSTNHNDMLPKETYEVTDASGATIGYIGMTANWRVSPLTLAPALPSTSVLATNSAFASASPVHSAQLEQLHQDQKEKQLESKYDDDQDATTA